MESFLATTLAAIPTAASSNLAFAAYGLALLVYLLGVYRVTRNKNLLQHLGRLPAEDRLAALEIEMGGVRLASGISPEQWVRSRIHRYYFLGFVISCVLILIVLGVAVSTARGSSDITVDLYQKSENTDHPQGGSWSFGSMLSFLRPTQARAADAEFVDPNTVVKKNDPLGFLTSADHDASDLDLRYDYQKSHNDITVRPVLGYVNEERHGDVVKGFSWEYEPFQWDFPYLSVKIVNNTNRFYLGRSLRETVQDLWC